MKLPGLNTNNPWSEFRRLQILYTLFIWSAAIPFVLLTLVTKNIIFYAAYGLAHMFMGYKYILRPLASLMCPVCEMRFFPEGGGNIYFVRCQNCRSKIGENIEKARIRFVNGER